MNIVLFFIALFFFFAFKIKKKNKAYFIMTEAKSYIKETKINHVKCS